MPKITLPLLLLFVSLQAFCIDENLDPNFCAKDVYDCTDSQREIVANFWFSKTPKIAKVESVYSGECTMVSSTYDGSHIHYGYVDFRKQDQQFGFHGEFAYFFEQNPYADLDVVRAQAKDPAPSPYLLSFREQDIRIVVNESALWQYFVRQSLDGSLFMIGQMGIKDSVICHLSLNSEISY